LPAIAINRAIAENLENNVSLLEDTRTIRNDGSAFVGVVRITVAALETGSGFNVNL
jgi:hypothetical protein